MFQKKPDVKTQVKDSQRQIRGNVRDLDKEIQKLKQEESKLILDIKRAARNGDQTMAKVLAKSLIKLRASTTKMYNAKAQLTGVSHNLTTAVAQQGVSKAFAQSSQAMGAMGKLMDPVKMGKQMQQFSVQNEKMAMAQEMFDDTLDDALDTDETEEESVDIMNQVLDEIGIDVSAKMSAAPNKRVAVQQQEEQEAQDDLTERLAKLRQVA
eukprot:TRINITY_DN31569_c0_g1_i1.p1 TRINITY_DN31569_c0_g1~~TRINITY_DN31569_c0_g1_i1.p1  ORF type:complete len:210 (-),score=57.64 TRINITY_DN31569_c0_g1_i1:152-781(-)